MSFKTKIKWGFIITWGLIMMGLLAQISYAEDYNLIHNELETATLNYTNFTYAGSWDNMYDDDTGGSSYIVPNPTSGWGKLCQLHSSAYILNGFSIFAGNLGGNRQLLGSQVYVSSDTTDCEDGTWTLVLDNESNAFTSNAWTNQTFDNTQAKAWRFDINFAGGGGYAPSLWEMGIYGSLVQAGFGIESVNNSNPFPHEVVNFSIGVVESEKFTNYTFSFYNESVGWINQTTVQLSESGDITIQTFESIPVQESFNYTWYLNETLQSDIFSIPVKEINPPTFNNQVANNTSPKANEVVNYSINISDVSGINKYIFSWFNETTGTWNNDSEVNVPANDTQVTGIAIKVTPDQVYYNYTWHAQDGLGTWGKSDEYSINITESNPPTFSNDINNGTSSTWDTNLTFEVDILDDSGIDYYIFSYFAGSSGVSSDRTEYYTNGTPNYYFQDQAQNNVAPNGDTTNNGDSAFDKGWHSLGANPVNYGNTEVFSGDLSLEFDSNNEGIGLWINNQSFTGTIRAMVYIASSGTSNFVFNIEQFPPYTSFSLQTFSGSPTNMQYRTHTNVSPNDCPDNTITKASIEDRWTEWLISFNDTTDTISAYIDGIPCVTNLQDPNTAYTGTDEVKIISGGTTPTTYMDEFFVSNNADYPKGEQWVNQTAINNPSNSTSITASTSQVTNSNGAYFNYTWYAVDIYENIGKSDDYHIIMTNVNLAFFNPPTMENNITNNTVNDLTINVSCNNLGVPQIRFTSYLKSLNDTTIVANGTTPGGYVLWDLNNTIVDNDGKYHYIGICVTDDELANTSIRYWTYDTTEPLIILESNNAFNSLNITTNPYSNDLYLNITTTDNEDLYAFQTIGRYPNGSVFLNYTTSSLSGSTSFNYNTYINVTNYPSSANYLFEIRASDSHTANKICPVTDDDCYKPKQIANGVEFDTPEGFKITMTSQDPATFDWDKKEDRYEIDVDFVDDLEKKRTLDLYADAPLDYLGDKSGIMAHFVVWDSEEWQGNWIDFLVDGVLPSEVKVKRITDYHYEIKFDKLKNAKFKSIGGMNINEDYYSYTRDRINMTYTEIMPEFPIDTSDLQTYCRGSTDLSQNVTYHWNVKDDGSLIYTGNSSYLPSNQTFNPQNITNTLTTVGENWTIECRALSVIGVDYTDFLISAREIFEFTLDNCSISNNTVLNFTSYNENSPATPLAIDIVGTLTYGIGTLSSELLIDYTNVTDFQLCIFPMGYTYDLNAYFQYHTSDDTGVQERYYIDNATISNETNQVYLYNFNDVTGLSELLAVTYDNTYSTFEGLLGKLQRFYPGENLWRTVQLDKTDDEGQLVFYVYQNTHDYRIIWEQDGVFFDQTQNLKFVCDSASECEASFVAIDQGVSDSFFGLTYSLTYDNSTETVTLNWVDSNAFVTGMRLLVEQKGLVNTVEICDTTLSSSSGTINCDITGYEGVITAKAYRAASPFDLFDRLTIEKLVKTLSEILSGKGLSGTGNFFSMLISVVLIGFGAATGSPIVVILFVILGAIVNFFLGIGTFFTYAILFTIGAVGLIVALVVRR